MTDPITLRCVLLAAFFLVVVRKSQQTDPDDGNNNKGLCAIAMPGFVLARKMLLVI